MKDTKNKAKEIVDKYTDIIKSIKINKIKGASRVLKKRGGFISKYVKKLAKKDGYL